MYSLCLCLPLFNIVFVRIIHVMYTNSFFLILLLGINPKENCTYVLRNKNVQGNTIQLQTGDSPNVY